MTSPFSTTRSHRLQQLLFVTETETVVTTRSLIKLYSFFGCFYGTYGDQSDGVQNEQEALQTSSTEQFSHYNMMSESDTRQHPVATVPAPALLRAAPFLRAPVGELGKPLFSWCW
jgi:hypothetical protein